MKTECCLSRSRTPPLPVPLPAPQWPSVSACRLDQPRRERLEQYIACIFHASYGARILEYLPLLFSLERDGTFCAALGMRSAAAAPLFCEGYLERPVEAEVLAHYGGHCERRHIMELGNLVASGTGQGALLYLLVAAAAHRAGVRHLLFCANRAVRLSIRRSGFTPLAIGPALPERLGAESGRWGSYYDGKPLVMLGDLALTAQQAAAQPAQREVLRRYSASVAALAAEIERHIP
jgi:hypothetical protein